MCDRSLCPLSLSHSLACSRSRRNVAERGEHSPTVEARTRRGKVARIINATCVNTPRRYAVVAAAAAAAAQSSSSSSSCGRAEESRARCSRQACVPDRLMARRRRRRRCVSRLKTPDGASSRDTESSECRALCSSGKCFWARTDPSLSRLPPLARAVLDAVDVE